MIVNALQKDELSEQQFVGLVLYVRLVYKVVDVQSEFDVADMNIHSVDNIAIVANTCVGDTLNAVNSVCIAELQRFPAPLQMIMFPMKVRLQQLDFDIVDMDIVMLAGNNVKG